MKSQVKKLTLSAMIAAIYFVFCFIEQGFASGAIQCRLSEALCLLPLFFPEAILGITIGCLIFNITTGIAYDMIFGTLATLLGGIITYFIGRVIKNTPLRIILGGLSPVLLNAIIIPFVIIYGYESPDAYWYLFLTVSIGEALAVYVAGTIIYFPMQKLLQKFKIIE